MQLINHPLRYRQGIRILSLVSRNKDPNSTTAKTRTAVTYDEQEFDDTLNLFASIAAEGQRIYSNAAPRSMDKAIRIFKERQLASERDPDPTLFYNRLEDRWMSALSDKLSVEKSDKIWMLDIDTVRDYKIVQEFLDDKENILLDEYSYDTKTGMHMLVKPFNIRNESTCMIDMLHRNPSMLWGY